MDEGIFSFDRTSENADVGAAGDGPPIGQTLSGLPAELGSSCAGNGDEAQLQMEVDDDGMVDGGSGGEDLGEGSGGGGGLACGDETMSRSADVDGVSADDLMQEIQVCSLFNSIDYVNFVWARLH